LQTSQYDDIVALLWHNDIIVRRYRDSQTDQTRVGVGLQPAQTLSQHAASQSEDIAIQKISTIPALHKWGLAQSPSCDCGQ